MADQEQKRTITGPGAADFIAAQGGEDHPETSPDKGSSNAQPGESPLADARNLVPVVSDDDEVPRNNI